MKRLTPLLVILVVTSSLLVFACMDTDIPPSGAHDSSVDLALDLSPAFDNGYYVTRVFVTIHKEGYSDSMSLRIEDNKAYGTFEDIPAGWYHILVELYEGDVLIAAGSGHAEVRAGQTTTAVIRLDFSTGNLEVIVVWGYICYPDLPHPELVFIGRDCGPVEPPARYYCFSITNWGVYPAELFEPAPDMPDTSQIPTSRTWVEIFAENGMHIFSITSFHSPQQLEFFWYYMPPGPPEPEAVYVELWDRKCDIRYRSNTVPLYNDTL